MNTKQVPKGRPKTCRTQPSLRDFSPSLRVPGVETPGYSREVPPGLTLQDAARKLICARRTGLLESTTSKAIPDQYQVVTLDLGDGRTLSGRIVSRDEQITRIAIDLMRPTESASVSNAAIRKVIAQPVSTMPSGLLNVLNEDELLDLVVYLKGGSP